MGGAPRPKMFRSSALVFRVLEAWGVVRSEAPEPERAGAPARAVRSAPVARVGQSQAPAAPLELVVRLPACAWAIRGPVRQIRAGPARPRTVSRPLIRAPWTSSARTREGRSA